MADAIIEAVAVEKWYAQSDGTRIQVIASTNLSIEAGKIVALLGPSGSGKSTLLRILSGLSEPSAGMLSWHGKPLEGQIPNVAIVFQSFALFPWLTVLGLLGLCGLPMPYHPVFNVPRFSAASRDRFFLCIEATDPMFELQTTSRFLESMEAKEVSEVAN